MPLTCSQQIVVITVRALVLNAVTLWAVGRRRG